MNEAPQPLTLRWADFDANFHLRHSVYYDFGATARLEYLNRCGLTYDVMQAQHFGPILFREEAIFRREVRPGDQIFINLQITKMRRDFSRWSFRHEITRADGTLCAVLNVDGAWIDTQLRKLSPPPAMAIEAFEALPKSADFEWS
ncbi:MAG: thioesterase family protein [Saprospiraceae bacterium]|nr:thioesterase family protein [Saprospiraceae bacterium]